MHYDFPLRLDSSGKTALVNDNIHIKNMIHQLLFTTIGERVNLAEFGTNVNQLLLGPNSSDIAASTKLLVQGSIQRWLGKYIILNSIDVKSTESRLDITIQYRTKKDQLLHEEKVILE